MAAQSNLARPYAQALFELAREEKSLDAWGEQLQLLAAVTSDSALVELTGDPRVSSKQLAALIIEVCGDKLSDGGKNLVRLLARNGRVLVAPQIADAYAVLKADAEKVITAHMITASSIDDDQQKQFEKALQDRLDQRHHLGAGELVLLVHDGIAIGDTVPLDEEPRLLEVELDVALARHRDRPGERGGEGLETEVDSPTEEERLVLHDGEERRVLADVERPHVLVAGPES